MQFAQQPSTVTAHSAFFSEVIWNNKMPLIQLPQNSVKMFFPLARSNNINFKTLITADRNDELRNEYTKN